MANDGGHGFAACAGGSNTVLSPLSPEVTGAERFVAEVLRDAINAAHSAGDGGASTRSIAERLKRAGYQTATRKPPSHQLVGRWTTPGSGVMPKLSAIPLMGTRVALAFCEILGTRLMAGAGPRDLRELALTLGRASGCVSGAILDALRDGKITRSELAEIEATALESRAAADQLLAECARQRTKGGAA